MCGGSGGGKGGGGGPSQAELKAAGIDTYQDRKKALNYAVSELKKEKIGTPSYNRAYMRLMDAEKSMDHYIAHKGKPLIEW